MGQFHSDFDEFEDSLAYQSIFNGKKCYIDMLIDDKGKTAIHKRAKGITLTTLDKIATDNLINDEYKAIYKELFNEKFNNKIKPYISDELFKIYDELFNEKALTFDLKSVRACFKNNNIRQITTCSSFTRKLSFKGKKNVVYC